MRIDVVVLTKNSDYILERCLDSVYNNIPINRLIVVDAFSTDRTLSILEKYRKNYRNVVLVQDAGTRATARQKGIELVKTEWFAFVDSDVVLREGWFEIVKRLIANDVGAIEGKPHSVVSVDVPLKFPKEHIQFNEAMGYLKLTIKKKGPEIKKAFTGDTLIRTSAVKGILIPSLLHRREDYYIRLHITRKGYNWTSSDIEVCDHYSVAEERPVSLEIGACTRLVALTSFKDAILNLTKSLPKGIYVAFKVKNSMVILYAVKYYWNYLVGWLKWKKVLT